MNNLTNEERARIFAMYIPCDIVQGDPLFNSGRRLVGIGGFETHEMQWGKLFNKASISNSFVSGFKLLLTPLSKITDEHAIEVANILFRLEKWVITKNEIEDGLNLMSENYIISYLEDVVRVTTLDTNFMDTTCTIISVYDRLRELGYALPYKGQSLFELGIAIDKTTL